MGLAFDQLLHRVRATAAAHRMPEPGARVLAAVSGGPDSVLLARVLHTLGYRIEIAHLDHGTRGAESHGDAEFTRALAGALGVPFHLARRDVVREAATAGSSFEQHARQVRYAFLEQTALAAGCEAVATGHHADDQAETVLLRLLRGAGPRGLAGIAPVRHGGAAPVVRPLIRCTRREILAALREQGWPWREDRSNADTAFARNRIRHELLPLLESHFNPSISAALARLAESHRELNDYLAPAEAAALARVTTASGIGREQFVLLHPAIARRCLLRMLEDRGVEPGFDRIVDAADFIARSPAGKRFDLGRGLFLYAAREHVEFLLPGPASAAGPISLPVPGDVRAGGFRFTAAAWTGPPPECPAAWCGPERQLFDADAVHGTLVVRCPRPGDRIRPLGMQGSRKVADCLREAGVPAPWRTGYPVLADDEGILWVTGGAVAARAAIKPKTQRVVAVAAARDREEDPYATE